jgi:hypothetical protein
MNIVIALILLVPAGLFGYATFQATTVADFITNAGATFLFLMMGGSVLAHTVRVAIGDYRAPRLTSTGPKLPRIIGLTGDGYATVQTGPTTYVSMGEQAAKEMVERNTK